MKGSVDLSIIIVNWNCGEVIFKCLDSINSAIKKYSYEIIIVDNNSKDGSLEQIQLKYPQIKIIKNKKNELFAKANNQGYSFSKGKYILLLNSDVFLTENSIDILVDYLEKGEKVVTCTLLNRDGTVQYGMHRMFPTLPKIFFSFLYLKFNINLFKKFADKYLYLDKSFSENFYIEQVAGAFILFDKEVINEIGYLFDERRFPLIFNDIDLSFRLLRANIKILCVSEVKVFHFRSFSLRKINKIRYLILWLKSFLLFKLKFLWK